MFTAELLAGKVGVGNTRYMDAAAPDNVTCIAPADFTGRCPQKAPSSAFLDTLHAVELHVLHRRFFTDYNLEIKASVTVQRGVIRGLTEASKLTLGPAALLAPPTKGNIPSLSSKTASELFGQLINESEAERPLAALEADYQEIIREVAQFASNFKGLKTQFDRMTNVRLYTCDQNAGDPTLPGVQACLEDAINVASHGLWQGNGPFSNEKAVEDLLQLVNDRLQIVANLQRNLAAAGIPAIAASVDADLTQLEKNVGTFRSNVVAAKAATEMYAVLQKTAQMTRTNLRKDQLRQAFMSQLRSLGGDQPAAVDDAELNALVNAYVEFLNRGGFQSGRKASARFEGSNPRLGDRCAEAPSRRTHGFEDHRNQSSNDRRRHAWDRSTIGRACC